ncbi:MAG: glycosyltransferase family 2 protein [Verrucomicrobia bacterium]|nr:glycosyltransferase family 2 protein [Verrucomicrobiota bacterium]
MIPPDLSIVIPIYNRGPVVRYTFDSVRRAAAGLKIETIVVDDGSTPPAAENLRSLGIEPTKLIRQENRGLLFARLAGLAAASGRYVLFLDSDDLVSSDKITAQVSAMDRSGADVSYTDTARTTLTGDYDQLALQVDAPLPATNEAADFYLTVQPAPHSPIFRRTYLDPIVATACFPPSPLYNPVAEIWFYHVAAPQPAHVEYVPGPRAIIGQHPETRLTNHWEKLGIASLAVMEAFARACPADTPGGRRARQLAGEKAFRAWRALPWDFSPEFTDRLLGVWRRLTAETCTPALGGTGYQWLARVLGPVGAARLLRRLRHHRYEAIRTLDDATLDNLLRALPPPG